MESQGESEAQRDFSYREDDYIAGPLCPTEGGTHGIRSQCEVLPGVRGIAERGNVITQWRGEAANYSQLRIEEQDQTHWKRLRF